MSGIYDYIKDNRSNITKKILDIDNRDLNSLSNKIIDKLSTEVYSFSKNLSHKNYNPYLEIFKEDYSKVKDILTKLENDSEMNFTEKSEKLFELMKQYDIKDYRLKPFINDIIKKYSMLDYGFNKYINSSTNSSTELKKIYNSFYKDIENELSDIIKPNILKKYKKQFISLFVKYGAIDLNNTLSYEVNNLLRQISKKESIDFNKLLDKKDNISSIYQNSLKENSEISYILISNSISTNDIDKSLNIVKGLTNITPLKNILTGFDNRYESIISNKRYTKDESNKTYDIYSEKYNSDDLYIEEINTSTTISISHFDQAIIDIKKAISTNALEYCELNEADQAKILKELTLLNCYEDLDRDIISDETKRYISYMYNLTELFRDNRYLKFAGSNDIISSFSSIRKIAHNYQLDDIDKDAVLDIRKNIKPIVNKLLEKDKVALPPFFNKNHNIFEFIDYLNDIKIELDDVENIEGISKEEVSNLKDKFKLDLSSKSLNEDFMNRAKEEPKAVSLKLKTLLGNKNKSSLLDILSSNILDYDSVIDQFSTFKDSLDNFTVKYSKDSEDKALLKISNSLNLLSSKIEENSYHYKTSKKLQDELKEILHSLGDLDDREIIDTINDFIEKEDINKKEKKEVEEEINHTQESYINSLLKNISQYSKDSDIKEYKLLNRISEIYSDPFYREEEKNSRLLDLIKSSDLNIKDIELTDSFNKNLQLVINTIKDSSDDLTLYNSLSTIDLAITDSKFTKDLLSTLEKEKVNNQLSDKLIEISNNLGNKSTKFINSLKIVRDTIFDSSDNKYDIDIDKAIYSLYNKTNDIKLLQFISNEKDLDRLKNYIETNHKSIIKEFNNLFNNPKIDRLLTELATKVNFTKLKDDENRKDFITVMGDNIAIFSEEDKLDLLQLLNLDIDEHKNLPNNDLLTTIKEKIGYINEDNNKTDYITNYILNSVDNIESNRLSKFKNYINSKLDNIISNSIWSVQGLFNKKEEIYNEVNSLSNQFKEASSNFTILDMSDEEFKYHLQFIGNKKDVNSIFQICLNQKDSSKLLLLLNSLKENRVNSFTYNNNLNNYMNLFILKINDKEDIIKLLSIKSNLELNGNDKDFNNVNILKQVLINKINLLSPNYIHPNRNIDKKIPIHNKIKDFNKDIISYIEKSSIDNLNIISPNNNRELLQYFIENEDNLKYKNIKLYMDNIEVNDLNNLSINNRDIAIASFTSLIDNSGYNNLIHTNLIDTSNNHNIDQMKAEINNIFKNNIINKIYKEFSSIESFTSNNKIIKLYDSKLFENENILNNLTDSILSSNQIVIEKGKVTNSDNYHHGIVLLFDNSILNDINDILSETAEDLYITNIQVDKDFYGINSSSAQSNISFNKIDNQFLSELQDSLKILKEDMDIYNKEYKKFKEENINPFATPTLKEPTLPTDILKNRQFKSLIKIALMHKIGNIDLNDIILTKPQIEEKVQKVIKEAKIIINNKQEDLKIKKEKVDNIKNIETTLKTKTKKLIEQINIVDQNLNQYIENLFTSRNSHNSLKYNYIQSYKNNNNILNTEVYSNNSFLHNQSEEGIYFTKNSNLNTIEPIYIKKEGDNHILYQLDKEPINCYDNVNYNSKYILNDNCEYYKDFDSLKEGLEIDQYSAEISLLNFKNTLETDLNNYKKDIDKSDREDIDKDIK
jgi:hypothetical protein